jgi:hypothetical protein
MVRGLDYREPKVAGTDVDRLSTGPKGVARTCDRPSRPPEEDHH